MTTDVIPFGNMQASGLEELAGMSPFAMNVVTDQSKTVKRRPGITTYAGAPSAVVDANGIVGVYGTNHRQLFAVGASGAERPIYSLTAGGSTALGGGLSPSGLRGTLRPVFAETELLLVIAGGDLPEKIVLSTLVSSRLATFVSATIPQLQASHVVASNLRLLLNDLVIDRTKVNYSEPAIGDTDFSGNERWQQGVGLGGYFTAETRPDDVVAIGQTSNNVLVLGTGTTQVFQPDPSITYAPIGTMETGISAPYSVVKADGELFWLDDKRRFIMSDGSGFTDISAPIKRSIDEIVTISDCFGYRFLSGYLDAIVWTFPTDGRTFCFQKGAGWGEWQGYTNNNWSPFQVNAHCLLPAYSPRAGAAESTLTNFVGLRDGHVGQLSLSATTDLGEAIVAKTRTGFINRKTDALKHCQCIRVAIRRGDTTSQPQGQIRYRDTPGDWSDPLPVDFGASGDTEIVVTFRSLGTYRRRQWEWTFSDTSDMSLVSVSEDFKVLSS